MESLLGRVGQGWRGGCQNWDRDAGWSRLQAASGSKGPHTAACRTPGGSGPLPAWAVDAWPLGSPYPPEAASRHFPPSRVPLWPRRGNGGKISFFSKIKNGLKEEGGLVVP